MAETEATAMVIDADALLEHVEPAAEVQPTQEAAEASIAVAEALADVATPAKESDDKTESEEVVSKVFTTVDEGGNEVQYVTMTQEEADAAAVEEEEQVVTTSLQFDPANPSVLYTADGTPINQADLSPEEQALVQAALQQHLAEQEAEQQLALIEQSSGDTATAMEQEVTSEVVQAATTSITTTDTQDAMTVTTAVASTEAIDSEPQLSIAETPADPIAVITPASESVVATTGVDIISSTTPASRIVQTLADNVRREQEYKKAQDLLERAAEPTKTELPEGFRYEEKIVIRQGQPQVVKVPVRAAPTQKRPEIPAVLANLMPKVEVGKDGSQVIRIHQSQITADQLKSLQENPNVRLVFRPASSSRGRGSSAPYTYPKKRGRPRKNYISAYSPALTNNDNSSKTSRYGRHSKAPYYQKDYLSGELDNGGTDADKIRPASQVYPIMPGRRGRPPGSVNKHTMDRGYRRAPSFARKMEQLREQEFQHDEELNNARLSIVPQKPVLTSVELAISTRRKNRLRELLSACSDDEIMEVALPHLARGFSLWEFLIMKVEKNKLSRVYFADVYKEYEILHRYMSRLTEKYKQALMEEKLMKPSHGEAEEGGASLEEEKKKVLKVRCKTLAQSLGLEQDDLEDAIITLLDAEEVTPPPTKPARSSSSEKETDPSQSSTNGAQTDQLAESGEGALKEGSTQSENETGNTAAETADSTEKDKEDDGEKMETEKGDDATEAMVTETTTEGEEAAAGGTQIIQIGTGDDKQFIEVPEGYTLIQTPEGLVMSQPGTTLSQAEDGTIYVTHEDGTTSTLDSQKTVPLESVESLITEEQQQEASQ